MSLKKKIEKKLAKLLAKILKKLHIGGDDVPASGGDGDEIPYSDLVWSYGGYTCKPGTKADQGALIAGLRVDLKNGRMSYSWKNGTPSRLWGADKTDPKAFACVFVQDGKKWVGGKFEWISASRLTREFGNIKGGYNGWDAGKFFSGKRFAFLIATPDGSRRTNVIVAG